MGLISYKIDFFLYYIFDLLFSHQTETKFSLMLFLSKQITEIEVLKTDLSLLNLSFKFSYEKLLYNMVSAIKIIYLIILKFNKKRYLKKNPLFYLK